MAARGAEAVAGGRPPCPLCEHADGPVRAHVSSLELTPAELPRRAARRPSSRSSAACATRRTRRSSSRRRSTASSCAAVYKPRRGERPLWDFPEGTLCQREVAAYELSDALGWDIVPAHDPARRPARRRHGAALRRPRSRRALLHPARRARGPLPRVRLVRRARQQHRPQGRPLPARPGERRRSSASTTASRSTTTGSCAPSSGTSPASGSRPRPPTTCAASSPSSDRRARRPARRAARRRRARRGRPPRPGAARPRAPAPRRLAQHPLAPRLSPTRFGVADRACRG